MIHTRETMTHSWLHSTPLRCAPLRSAPSLVGHCFTRANHFPMFPPSPHIIGTMLFGPGKRSPSISNNRSGFRLFDSFPEISSEKVVRAIYLWALWTFHALKMGPIRLTPKTASKWGRKSRPINRSAFGNTVSHSYLHLQSTFNITFCPDLERPPTIVCWDEVRYEFRNVTVFV